MYDKFYNKDGVNKMSKTAAMNTVEIPMEEYKLLRELYKNARRQQFLLRLDEAEKNLKARKVKKVTVDKFIENI